MKITHGRLVATSLATSLILAVSAGPALSVCIKKHPLFGIDTYVDDKYCQKKVVKKNTANSASPQAPMVKRASPTAALKPEKRVKTMQAMLASKGYNPGPVDGLIGPATQKAARAFNLAHGLPAKAAIGSTIAVLRPLMGKSAPSSMPSQTTAITGDNEVREMQTLLTGLGYKPGPSNGIEGPKTTRALRNFHLAMGVGNSTTRANSLVLLHRASGN